MMHDHVCPVRRMRSTQINRESFRTIHSPRNNSTISHQTRWNEFYQYKQIVTKTVYNGNVELRSFFNDRNHYYDLLVGK